MTEDKPLGILSKWNSVQEHWVGQPRSSRQSLNRPAKKIIRVWLLQFKKQLSLNHFCVKWAISICRQAASNCLVMHKRSKPIDTQHHFLQENVDDNSIHLVYTPTDQLAAICWRRNYHKSELNSIDNNFWVICKFFSQQTEKSEWGCWRIQLRIFWATKLERFFKIVQKWEETI